ncbi:protein lethal(2)denticleless [Homalodisca vitripennis]|nr:protein lethal(2)denticleless [Homalodisca vitripennis]
MNILEERELVQYGFRSAKRYDLAIKMLKSYKWDEFRSLSSAQDTVGEPPVFACRFCKIPGFEHLLALANEDGKIGIQDTKSEYKERSVDNITCTQGHMNAIFDLSWSDSSLRLVSVSGDHTAMLWDVSASTVAPLGMFEGHTRSVKMAAFRPSDTNVFATGARDGLVIMWDYRCSQPNTTTIKPDNIISNAHCQSGSTVKKTKRKEPSRADSITGLVFQDPNFLISCSAGDGLIKVWDIRKCYTMYRRLPQPCYSLVHPGTSAKNGFTSLSVDPGAVRLFANCMDNNIYCYNIATYEKQPVAKYYGHLNQTFYIKSSLSVDGEYILSGSSDERGYVWRVKQPGPPLAQLMGHSAEVTCVDWAAPADGSVKVVTCADDACHRLWRLCPPTDNENKDPDLVGWTECADTTISAEGHPLSTPCSLRRMVRRQQITPESCQDEKRQKTTDRVVLSTVQPCSESRGARRLFDGDSSSSCKFGLYM